MFEAPDARLDCLTATAAKSSVIVEFVDTIGGGAVNGRGTGNKFWRNNSWYSTPSLLVRCFEDDNGFTWPAR
jgi:ribosome-binding ATPase YchF (GTP1/OBG family)